MGGDHKCPVCQATFTRPQHVARHMRSHTGDRPYKCQFCGDQFARSDLLSRHVNKCHAGEKPPPGASTSRRKGSSSASRATTSKQACDQCVQSSLPCDGANPCVKCVQRKSRCTYVKFHRQTAPIGPGHDPRSQLNPASSSRLPGYASPDDFLLGPPPIPGDPASLSSYHPAPFTFPQLYSATTDSAPPSLTMPHDGDYAKYRNQAEYIRRQSLPFTSGPGLPPPSGLPPPIYGDGRPSSSTSWLGWSSETTSQLASGGRPPFVDDLRTERHHGPSSYTYPPVAADPYASSYALRRLSHDRPPSVDFSSDSSTSHSIPSSASSSNVHLPLVDLPSSAHSQHQQQLAYHDAQAQAHANFLQSHPPPPPHSLPEAGLGQGPGAPSNSADVSQRQHPEGGAVSSAFGLMSLDDPAILAGLSNDSAPFFTSNGMDIYPGDPDATPMPPKPVSKVVSQPLEPLPSGADSNSDSLSPSSRDAETKQLKDFWRQYIRTPFSASTPQAVHGGHLSNSATPVSPGPGYRRPRVSSFPSAQTPSADPKSQHTSMNVHGPAATGDNDGVTSSMRTTLHGSPEDLRSYEAAVLARRTPLNLNLVPRRSRGSTASSATSPLTSSAKTMTVQHPFDLHPLGSSSSSSGGGGGGGGGSRPSSASSSTSSSLAHAFGQPHHPSNNVTFAYGDHSHGHGGHRSHHHTNPPSSRGSTASSDDMYGERDALRPSFKRLPSQTLGPANSKRAMLDHDHDDDHSDTGPEDDGRKYRLVPPHFEHPQQQPLPQPYHHHLSPPLSSSSPSSSAALANHRKRRMSAPDTSPTVPSFTAAGQL